MRYFVLVFELKGAVGASAKTLAAPLASAAGGGGKPLPQPGVQIFRRWDPIC